MGISHNHSRPMSVNESVQRFFASLRSGSLLSELNSLWDEQCAKDFLPTLMLTAFPPGHTPVGNPSSGEILNSELDPLRARLLEVRSGNELMRFMRVDFGEVAERCEAMWKERGEVITLDDENQTFLQMEPLAKILHVCEHLISKGELGFR